MRPYTRQELMDRLYEITELIGKVPTQRELRAQGITDDPFRREFGSWSAAKAEFESGEYTAPVAPEVKPTPSTGIVDKLLEQLRSNLSEQELKAIVQATGTTSVKPKLKHTQHETGHFKMLVMSDTHIGHSKFREDWWHHMVDRATREKVDFAYHAGDILEGMSGRGGHVYELDCIGFESQFAKAKRLIGSCPFQVRGIIGNHDCLSEDTEVLTRRGWLAYTDLQESDEIFSWTRTGGKWDKITEVYTKDIDDELVHIKNQHVDMLTTKTHRVLNYKRGSDHTYGAAQYTPAEELSGRVAIPVAAEAYNEERSSMLDDEIGLLGWVLTDGACKNGKVSIYQSKDLTRIVTLLDNLNIEYKVNTRHRDITEVCGKKLKKPPLPQHTITFKYNIPDKYPFPSECFKFNDYQFEIFIQSIIDGDGHRYNNGRDNTHVIHGTKIILDHLQHLCSMHGYRTTLVYDTRGCPRLNVHKSTTTQFDVSTVKKLVPYKGRVWCLSVPETNFMVRRNGRSFFTGNCWFSGKADQGINVGSRLEESLDNFVYLGADEADQTVENVKIKLFHGGGGAAYSLSYRAQKVVESLDGGDKPHILITGHDHKALFFQTRNVHVIGAGTLCEQTSFMRGKSLAAHRGYWIVDVWSNEEGLVRIRPEWNPFY